MRFHGRVLGWFLLVATSGLTGCTVYDNFMANRSFGVQRSYSRDEALKVIAEDSDHNKRARAFTCLKEPIRNGGSDKDQEVVLNVLCTAAAKESQAYCRLCAIQSLRTFKDPRAVKGLEDAYYEATAFPAETATVIRCQAISALGEVGDPSAVNLLARIVKEPQVEGPDQDRQMRMDERQAAARSLGRFNQPGATTALVQVLKDEKDVALRNCAHHSLEEATGKNLPPDATAWEKLLYEQGQPQGPSQPGGGNIRLTGGQQRP